MHQLNGIPESDLAMVIEDMKRDGLKIVSRYETAKGIWTLITRPATKAELAADAKAASAG
ncbi:hypothetical protein [Rhizobium sp. PAMB 3182]